MSMDDVTVRWIRNRSDDLAIAKDCRFDEERASYAVWWIERYCRLYEGIEGDPLILCGCHECGSPQHVMDEWFLGDGQTVDPRVLAIFLARAKKHCECVAAGHFVDWQYDTFMRLFGWVRWSDKWDRWIRRFRQLSAWMAKKNKKSPSMAALGLHLTCGDGEPGNNVFYCAKDGKQAKDGAARHAIEMLHQSPELSLECTVNKVESRITHEESRSILKPLSSSNARTKESKEGLNGSALIDETHVVDRDFVGRLSRMGISRAEPLQCEFSTAGDNPTGYGKERFDRASAVMAGDIEDQELLAVVCAAPQDLTPEQFEAEPLKYARMANPALGHTVEFDELMTDYHRSISVSADELAKFMMYRLNVWQFSSNPAIRKQSWDACAGSFALSELDGKPCCAALDLGYTHDSSALALLFPWGERDGNPLFRLLMNFWLPEEVAQRERALVPWFDWSNNGDLTLTGGASADFALIRREIVALSKRYAIQELVYDPRYAAVVCQDLKDDHRINVKEFNQGYATYTEPCEQFKAAVLEGRVQHYPNACMDWQVCSVVFNAKAKQVMPVKPKNNAVARIDGAAAAIMGQASLSMFKIKRSVYETRGVLQV